MEGLNRDELVNALREIGIENGSVLEVHCSLSSFGHVDGGAETVISALKAACGNSGSIFMPALRLSNPLLLTKKDKALGITSKIRILPENRERSAMGIVADTFRMQEGTLTGDGIFQISGWGKHAEEAVKGGLNYAIESVGMALLLGVDIYKLTAMHYVEGDLPKEIGNIFAPTDEINEIYPRSEWMIEVGAPPVKPWYTIQDIAYEKGLIKDGYIRSSKYMYFKISDVIELYRQELRRDPFKLYGLK